MSLCYHFAGTAFVTAYSFREETPTPFSLTISACRRDNRENSLYILHSARSIVSFMAAEDVSDLRRALEQNEIIPYFQPLVELRTGLLCGFEVLSRWKHPLRGLVGPDDFIPLAERNGLNGLLTGNLLRAVFADAKDIPEHLTLSVNISLTQLTDLTLPKHIRTAAEQANFPLSRLILEITESALVSNSEPTFRIAQELKEQGSRLALDDFGTGYSSLRHLQSLPFDELKIDASFVRSITHTRESRKIAAAVIGLGNSLGLLTVAEGVETQAIADMLLWLGCDLGQGWVYGRPAPSDQLPAVLAERMHASPSAFAEARSYAIDTPTPPRLEALPAQRLAQLHAIYDGVPVGICFLDRNLRFVSVNKRLAEIHQLPVSAHLGRSFAEVLPGQSRQWEPYLQRALDGEPSTDLEICYPDPSRRTRDRTYLISYQPARDEADEVIGVSISVVDITRRKRIEEALAESEDHYRHTVELNPQVPWTASPDGMILDVSNRWETLTGLTKQESLGDGWLRVLHTDDLEPTLKAWSKSLRSGEPVDVRYRIHWRDGSWRWMRARAAPRRNEEGTIIRWYGTVEDIDDYHKAQDALRRSEARLQAVFNAVPVGIVIAEAPDGRIVMSNPRAEDILRRTAPAPRTIDDYHQSGASDADGTPLEPHEYPLARAILYGESTDPKEILYRHDDGSRVWISLTAAPVLGKDGDIAGGVVAIQDIDQDKREHQRLMDLNAILRKKLENCV
jgi:PAS domain S-box-containing protein